MSEEKNTQTTEKQCDCFCKSEGFRNFLVVALGTFAGVYMALSLFTAIHKPPMPCHHMFPPKMHKQFMHQGDFGKMDKKFFKEFKGEIREGKKLEKPDVND